MRASRSFCHLHVYIVIVPADLPQYAYILRLRTPSHSVNYCGCFVVTRCLLAWCGTAKRTGRVNAPPRTRSQCAIFTSSLGRAILVDRVCKDFGCWYGRTKHPSSRSTAVGHLYTAGWVVMLLLAHIKRFESIWIQLYSRRSLVDVLRMRSAYTVPFLQEKPREAFATRMTGVKGWNWPRM